MPELEAVPEPAELPLPELVDVGVKLAPLAVDVALGVCESCGEKLLVGDWEPENEAGADRLPVADADELPPVTVAVDDRVEEAELVELNVATLLEEDDRLPASDAVPLEEPEFVGAIVALEDTDATADADWLSAEEIVDDTDTVAPLGVELSVAD